MEERRSRRMQVIRSTRLNSFIPSYIIHRPKGGAEGGKRGGVALAPGGEGREGRGEMEEQRYGVDGGRRGRGGKREKRGKVVRGKASIFYDIVLRSSFT